MQKQLEKHYHALTIHTGQHYDANMSSVFFEELGMAKPDYLLSVGGTKKQGEQTATMMIEIEKICENEKPDAILLYGDTNSTLAGALIAAKMNIPQIHVEAGLRSFNRTMPEEVNRIIADEFAYLLFTPTQNGIENLNKEGISHERIFLTGDVMCDTLNMVKDKVKKMVDTPYYFATVHRPYNTDDPVQFQAILNELNKLDHPVHFPIHPRTLSRLNNFGINIFDYKNLVFIDPIGYVESVAYQMNAECIITDSGGMQKEAYMLRKRCVTLRSETEWVETLQGNWNQLLFSDFSRLKKMMSEPLTEYQENVYGNGTAAVEIVDHIRKYV